MVGLVMVRRLEIGLFDAVLGGIKVFPRLRGPGLGLLLYKMYW